jgi:hypothetical protein
MRTGTSSELEAAKCFFFFLTREARPTTSLLLELEYVVVSREKRTSRWSEPIDALVKY